MRLAKRMPAGDQRHGLIVIHRHARESLADVLGRSQRVRLAVRPFRIDVDQPHLHRAKRLLELTIAVVALIAQPGLLVPPVDVLFRLPHVLAPAGEPERLEPHRIEGDVAGQNHQVGPRKFTTVLLFDGPE